MRRSLALPFPALLLALAAGCGDPDTFVPDIPGFSGPAGVVEGTLTYTGPPPCTENGKVVGAALVLAFDKRLLPPPSGLGTGAASLDAIPADVLFASVRDKLVFDKDGKLRCPDASAPNITASGTWTIAPLSGGTYQFRGFYDRDGDFNPAFSISNLPTAGDVGGGAIDNAAEVLMGAAPRYTEVNVGEPDGKGNFVIPAVGVHVPGVGVTLGQVLPLERPVFYPSAVDDSVAGNTDPRKVVVPSDFEFETFPPKDTSFIRITFSAGVADAEIDAAALTPFFLPVKDPAATLYMALEDVNGDGQLTHEDHVVESAGIPQLYPSSVFSKINAPRLANDKRIETQSRPRVIMQGLTLLKNLLLTSTKLPPAMPDPMNPVPPFQSFEPEVTVAVRPAALCIDPVDPSKKGVFVLSRKTAADGAAIIADEEALKQGLAARFGRPFDIVYGCLPEGQYSMNLVYPTGQAWSVPNEAGVCALAEPQTSDGKTCKAVTNARPRLVSQDAMLIVGAPKDAAYCKANPTPTACTAL
ncbi:hypothetical protein [Polyangium mundeleinium]|uniref:EF-hand domain-containing protein n=1 Tax=Polyangium mundeleinium TaxID=2995306 RepID=A0ABT5EPM7_9BACT|nr:hypothetical protein [Polyangium mundeleinium]MDC0742676.1 hypothetical protein [Polyangium mundeleinium]